MDTFGFRVRRESRYDEATDEMLPTEPPRWTVSLPHQCDSWDIAGEHSFSYSDGVEQHKAVAALERFIAEAQATLAALRRGEEIGPE